MTPVRCFRPLDHAAIGLARVLIHLTQSEKKGRKNFCETHTKLFPTARPFFPPTPGVRAKHAKPLSAIVFDRMRNQAGEFVYQLNDHGINQKAIPSHTFVIPASRKRKILSQLNTIGINQKFIYPDHDNIAQYYAKNYSKSFQKKIHPLSFKSGNSHK